MFVNYKKKLPDSCGRALDVESERLQPLGRVRPAPNWHTKPISSFPFIILTLFTQLGLAANCQPK